MERNVILRCILFLVLAVLHTVPRLVTAQEQAGGIEVHVAALSSLDPQQRIVAVRALGELRDPAAVGPLSNVLRTDPVGEVRGWTIRSLAQIDTVEARTAIALAAQSDADERVRALAAQHSGGAAPPPQAQTAEPAPQQVAQPQERRPPMMRMGLPRPQRSRRPGLGMMVAGWVTFGLSYSLALITGGVTMRDAHIDTWPMFIPLFGGIIELAFAYRYTDGSDIYYPGGLSIPAFINALVQMGGLALAITGQVRRSRAQREEGENGSSARRFFAVLPSGQGLSVVGAF